LAKPRVSSRSMVATSSSSRVARSRSESPWAASLARVATSSASVRLRLAISATAWIRRRSLPNARSCSCAASATRLACAVASAVAVDVLDEPARLLRRAAALLGEPPHLFGHDREPLAVLPGPRRLDRRVQRQQVGHVGELADRRDEARDAAAQLAERLHLGRALADEAFEGHEPLDGVADLLAVLVGDLARHARRLGGLAAVLRHAARHLREGLRRLQ